VKDFRDLKVWEKSHELTLQVYKLTRCFPREEMYGLSSQLRRAAMSIPANIAEGCGRGTDADFGRFLQYAMGSSSEVEYELLLAHDLEYLDSGTYAPVNQLVIEVKRMLTSLLQTVRT
jgi:four helix bundle protein